MGYLQSQEEGLGLPTIQQALREEYGPACQKASVRLYVECKRNRTVFVPPDRYHEIYEHPAYGRAKMPEQMWRELVRDFQKIPSLTGIAFGYNDLFGEGKAN